MTCRETLTLDLAEFLARPNAPEFAAFRAHYPRCADCAGEVCAWSELHAALSASTHPSPETLLRYEDARLADADRRTVAQHLAACSPCRDELRALAAFDREAARAARPVVAERRPWLRLPEWGRLVLHPALAYGLVLALLFYPALRGRREEPRSSGEEKLAAEPQLADRLAAASREERPAAPERYMLEQRAAEAPPPAASGGGAEPVLSLGPNLRPRLGAQGTADQVTLRMPVRAGGTLEVRVLAESGERELRERVAATNGVEVRVPRVWLVPGRYRVELRSVGADASQVDVFAFEVGR